MMSTYELPPVAFNTAPLRRRILAHYWVIFILGIPLWWATTSIQRLALPSVPSFPKLRFPLHIVVSFDGFDKVLQEERARNPVGWRDLDVIIQRRHERRQKNSESTYDVELHPSFPSVTESSVLLSGRDLRLRRGPGSMAGPEISATFARTISGLLAPHTTSHARVVARYAPTYRLAFSLLNEDASTGGSALRWDIRAGIEHFLAPTLAQLKILHNFTVESQVQFHAPLAFIPPQNKAGDYVLGEEELKIFINSADWTLASSVSEDPVLHFILFVPSASRRPLKIHTHMETDSFIVPQWGGVVILPYGSNDTSLSLSDLTHPFHTFRAQLLTLVGVHPLPDGVSGPENGMLSEWQLDTLLRRRTFENTRDSLETLISIVRLVEQIANMPVGQDVRGDVQDALNAIEQVYESASTSPRDALRHSARANTLSSRAFFNPGMLALLYFPAEHKYAVYIPLFAPVSVPLIAAALREIRRWRRELKEQRTKVD